MDKTYAPRLAVPGIERGRVGLVHREDGVGDVGAAGAGEVEFELRLREEDDLAVLELLEAVLLDPCLLPGDGELVFPGFLPALLGEEQEQDGDPPRRHHWIILRPTERCYNPAHGQARRAVGGSRGSG